MRSVRGVSQRQLFRRYDLEDEYARRARVDGDAGPVAGESRGAAGGGQGAVLGAHVTGERALPTRGRQIVLSPARLCRHVLVCGAPGSGKTETVLRLAWAVASGTDAPVFYVDGKGDRENARRFVGLMADAGRRTRVFPNEPFDAWRGEPHEIRSRLMEIVEYAREGPGAWYRDVAKNVLGLVCEHPDGPPRSSGELLARMDLEALKRAHGPSGAAQPLRSLQVEQVRLRYQAFFGETRGALDGGWAWEDAQAAYVLLDSLRLHEETAGVTRLLLEDFAGWFAGRKPRERLCVVAVDEYAALADVGRMAGRLEQARGFNTAMILAPQVVAGLGGASEVARILGSVETVVCHRVNTPDELIALAGTREETQYSTRFSSRGSTGEGTASRRERWKIDPNDVRGLPPGEAFLISGGRAMRARVFRAPALSGELPEISSDRGDRDVPTPAEPSFKQVGAGTETGLPLTEQPKEGDAGCRKAETDESSDLDFLP
jgi:hypothetical protein